MLLEKYRPEKLENMLGNAAEKAEIKKWLDGWKKGEALIIYGHTGCGKTLSVRLFAKEFGYEVLESSAGDVRSYQAFREKFAEASKQRSLFSKYTGKILLIDEIDMLDSAKAVIELIRESGFPVILVASDPYIRSLQSLRRCCRLLRFNKINHISICSYLKKICNAENIAYEDAALSHIARACGGDIRSALIDIELLKPAVIMESVRSLGIREQSENIFNTLKIIFNTQSIANVKIALENCELSENDAFSWLRENIPSEYNAAETAEAYSYLAKASVFSSRIIRNQSWELLKYFSEIAFYGAALSGKSSKKFVSYKPPKFFFSRKSEEGLEKIARKLHVSKREALRSLDMIKALAANDAALLDELGLSEDEKKAFSNGQ